MAAIKAISESRASLMEDATQLVLWAALHLQYTSRYCLGYQIHYDIVLLFREWPSLILTFSDYMLCLCSHLGKLKLSLGCKLEVYSLQGQM